MINISLVESSANCLLDIFDLDLDHPLFVNTLRLCLEQIKLELYLFERVALDHFLVLDLHSLNFVDPHHFFLHGACAQFADRHLS